VGTATGGVDVFGGTDTAASCHSDDIWAQNTKSSRIQASQAQGETRTVFGLIRSSLVKPSHGEVVRGGVLTGVEEERVATATRA
jgi:hypothetical protein